MSIISAYMSHNILDSAVCKILKVLNIPDLNFPYSLLL